METGHPPPWSGRGNAATRVAVGLGEFLRRRCRRPDCPSAFPALSRRAPFPFAGVGDGTWRPRRGWTAKGAQERAIAFSSRCARPKDPVMFVAERFGGPRVPGVILRSFPSPPSREPDLASAIFPSPSSLRFCFQHFGLLVCFSLFRLRRHA